MNVLNVFQRHPGPTVVPQPPHQCHAVLFSEYFFHPVSVVLFLHGGKFLLVKLPDDWLALVVLQLVDGWIPSKNLSHLENFLREVVSLAENTLIPAHPNRVPDSELRHGKLSESRTVKGARDPHNVLVGRVHVRQFHESAAVFGTVVVFNEFFQDVYPSVSSFAVKIFPYHGFYSSVEPFHDGGLFVRHRGEVGNVMTLQKIPDADVVKSTLSLRRTGRSSDTCRTFP